MGAKRFVLAGWLAGVVVGLSQAWWWGNVYLAMSVLLGGVVLTVTACIGARHVRGVVGNGE